MQAGATAYSVIIGAFGALAVPAIVIVFTAPAPSGAANLELLKTFASGLLVVGMIGSLLGAIALAFLGAERDPIASLAAALMYVLVPVAISTCCLLGAFEILADLYQPSARTLFAMIVAVGGLFGVVYGALAVVHSITLGPTSDEERTAWLKTERVWLRTRKQAERAAVTMVLLDAPIVIFVGVLRLLDVHVDPTRTEVNSLVGVGIGLTLIGTLLGVIRASPSHRTGLHRSLSKAEAYGTNVVTAFYIAALVVVLP